MKTQLLTLSLLFFSVVFAKAEDMEQIKINPQTHYQEIEGWGSSLCWWAHMTGRWDDDKIDEIIDWIVSPKGLNMNIFRYNIGGGDDPSHADGHMVKGKGKRAEMEGFKDSAESAFNWDADAGQRKIMLKIKEKRPDAIFEAFSNSAPYWMTYSGCAAGNSDPMADNLKPEFYEPFCDYLIEVCKHYKEKYNIEFRTLEPFNESTSNYWYNQGSQEGCHFNISSQINVLRILYPKLKASGLNTAIAASDETNLISSIAVLKAFQSTEDIMNMIEQFNTHTYSGTNPERKELQRLIDLSGKRFWQSETGPSGGAGLRSNLGLAQKMFNDLRYMHPHAWLDWQMIEENGDTWCQIRGNFATQEYTIVKNYYVRMQVTRFIKQGYTLIDTNQDNVLAAISPNKKELVFVLLNIEREKKDCMIDLSLFNKVKKKATVYRTSRSEDCLKLKPIVIEKKKMSYTAPGNSITTFVLAI